MSRSPRSTRLDVVGTDVGPVTENQPFTEQLSVSSLNPDITRFEVTGEVGYAYIAMDDVTVTTPDAPPPPTSR